MFPPLASAMVNGLSPVKTVANRSELSRLKKNDYSIFEALALTGISA